MLGLELTIPGPSNVSNKPRLSLTVFANYHSPSSIKQPLLSIMKIIFITVLAIALASAAPVCCNAIAPCYQGRVPVKLLRKHHANDVHAIDAAAALEEGQGASAPGLNPGDLWHGIPWNPGPKNTVKRPDEDLDDDKVKRSDDTTEGNLLDFGRALHGDHWLTIKGSVRTSRTRREILGALGMRIRNSKR